MVKSRPRVVNWFMGKAIHEKEKGEAEDNRLADEIIAFAHFSISLYLIAIAKYNQSSSIMKIASTIVVIAWLATSTEGRLLGRGRGKNKGSSTTPWEQPDTTAATDAPPVTSLLPSLPRYVRMSNNRHILYCSVGAGDMHIYIPHICHLYSFSLFFIAHVCHSIILY